MHSFEEHFPRLKGAVRAAVYDYAPRGVGVHGPEDIVQEACLKIFLNFDRYDQEVSKTCWAYTIGKNTALDRLKSSRQVRKRMVSMQDMLPCEDDDVDSLKSVGYVDPFHLRCELESCLASASLLERLESYKSIDDEDNYLATLRECAEALPPSCSRMFSLQGSGLTYRKISAELGVPIGTVMSGLNRARKLLSERYVSSRAS